LNKLSKRLTRNVFLKMGLLRISRLIGYSRRKIKDQIVVFICRIVIKKILTIRI